MEEYGEPQNVVKQRSVELPSLKPEQVLVRMLAAPINPADINTIQGMYAVKPDLPCILGNEGVAEVLELGSNAGSYLEVGDWVIPARPTSGTWRTHVIAEPTSFVKLPPGMDRAAAATISVNPSTAYRMLRDFVTLQPGDTVIQNAANSAVGRAVIQLCAHYGYKSINVVRDRPTIAELKKDLTDLGADVVVTERELRQVLLLVTYGGMARQVLLLVTYGGMARRPVTVPVGSLIFNDVRLQGYWQTRWSLNPDNQTAKQQMFDDLCDLVKQGKVSAPPYRMVNFDDYMTALNDTMPPEGQVLTSHLQHKEDSMLATVKGYYNCIEGLIIFETSTSYIKKMSKSEKTDEELASLLFSSGATFDVSKLGATKRRRDSNILSQDTRRESSSLGTKILDSRPEQNEKKTAKSDNEDSEEESDSDSFSEEPAQKRIAAWVDDDDLNTNIEDAVLARTEKMKFEQAVAVRSVRDKNYQEFLQDKFTAVVGDAPTWADLDAAQERNEEEEDEDAIQLGCNLISSEGGALPPSYLKYRWLSDVNKEEEVQERKNYLGASLKSTFAANHPLALVTRRQNVSRGNGFAQIYQVGPEQCHKLDEFVFKKYPICCSAFMPCSSKFIVGAQESRHFYIYDIEASKEMKIQWNSKDKQRKCTRNMEHVVVVNEREVIVQDKDELVMLDTRLWRPVDCFRPPTQIGSFCVSHMGDTIYSFGRDDGQVTVWDYASRRARAQFTDEGCINGTAIDVSPNHAYIVCGSNTGIVNIYSAREVEMNPNPRPLKTLSQLVTSVNCVKFNSSSEALVFSSQELPNAVRIAHLPSFRVYSNFPRLSHNLDNILDCSFSPNSGYLALCSSMRRVHRMRLQYFSKY
ncbi:Alcohol dehydrogenase N-terminal [Trinorchestia longiramus]|nr:Alcohol dehydrogenase N-terminal [Trinorchestia longiramus]